LRVLAVVVVAVSACLSVCLLGCGEKADGGKGGKGAGKPTVVRTMEAREEQVERVVEITGTLAGAEQVMVSAEVEGRVERVAADLGDVVNAGGLLVQLAPHVPRLQAAQADADYATALAGVGVDDAHLDAATPDGVASVRRAKADREEAARNLARIQELFDKKVATQSDLDAARTRDVVGDAGFAAARDEAMANIATARSRRAAWGLARKRVSDTSISSPVAGVVAARLVSLGELVKPGQVVAHVVVSDTLKLRGDVPERYADVVVKGLALDVDGPLSTSARGTVARVGPLVDAASRTFPIEATFDNKDQRLKPGTFARARVVTGLDESVIALPETAVSNLAGVTKVYVVDDGGDAPKAVERRVQVLRKRGSDALITGDVKPGDRIIITAIARLFPGAPIEIEKGATTTTTTTPPAGASR
jgi:RND family efflux transporter MFP subunit